MAWHIHRLVQNGATRFDFTNDTYASIQSWEFGDGDGRFVTDKGLIGITGASVDALAAKINLLKQVFEDAAINLELMKEGRRYTPIWMETQIDGGSYLLRSEVLGGKAHKSGNFFEKGLRGPYLSGMEVKVYRRDYYEESSPLTLINAVAYSNNLARVDLSAVRGDVPIPLFIKCAAGTSATDDQVVAALLGEGTFANHIPRLEADDTGGTGYSVTYGNNTGAYTDANFSGGKGAEFTPANTSDQMRVRWTLDGSGGKSVVDQLHRVRVLVRGYEVSGSGSGAVLRARMGIATGSTRRWGAWSERKTLPVGSFSTDVPLIDLGLNAPPDLGSASATNFSVVFELYIDAASGSGPKVRIDWIAPLPVFEGGKVQGSRSGFAAVTLPRTLDASNLGVMDAHDRAAFGYVADTSDNFVLPLTDINGKPLFLKPNTAMALYVLTKLSSGNQTHKQSVNNTLTIKATPRYRLPLRG